MIRCGPFAVCVLVVAAHAADPPGADEWKYDVIVRKAGEPLRGLVVEEGDRSVKIHWIWRKPGKPTLVFTEIVPRREISRVVLLEKADREALQGRLDALKRERAVLADHLRALDPRGKGASKAADALDFRETTWPGDDKSKALEYRSSYFRLVANTRPELAQLAAIHLEQVYAAYSRLLPPKAPKATPTTILLTRSLADYQALVKGRGLKLFNPAFYDPARNQVVCGSDLERMFDELHKVRAHHTELRAKMKERRADLARAYKGKIPAQFLAPMDDAEKRIVTSERRNEAQFARARQRLFHRLYHEAFHAYVGTFVYPAKDGPLPVWFDEGLAQIFETAIVEVGELRVRAADPDRLAAVRKAMSKGEHPSLSDLLRATGKQFQVGHSRDEQVSDAYYRAAWALAVFLTFEKRVLGTKALDDYVASLKREADPLLAFRVLVGKPLPAFEKELGEYLANLRSDGTVDK
jgi:Protein of unknown function (DUF1570)